MKRIVFLLMVVIGGLPIIAQTNFRSLTLDEAIQAAKSENKLVFIDFYTTWCGPCKMMMKNVFPQPKVGEYFNNKYVCIKLDAEKEGKEVAGRFQVKAYPTFVVLDTDEKVLLKKEGGNFDGLKFVSEIETGVNPDMTPERLRERYASGERTPQLVDAYASLIMKEARQGRRMDQRKLDEANRIIFDYFNGLTDEQKLSAPNSFIYSYAYTQSVVDPKAVYMIANREKFSKEIAELIDGYIASLYQIELQNFMDGSKPYDKSVYIQLKKQIIDCGMNKEGKWNIPFRLIETHALGDLNEYLAVCEEDFGKMPEDLKAALYPKFHQVIQTDDKDILKRAIRFMRNQLPDLDSSTIFFGVSSLMQLEKMAGLSDR